LLSCGYECVNYSLPLTWFCDILWGVPPLRSGFGGICVSLVRGDRGGSSGEHSSS